MKMHGKVAQMRSVTIDKTIKTVSPVRKSIHSSME